MKIETLAITNKQATDILGIREDHFRDFKSKLIKPAKLSRTISAFANSSGGDIFLGIEDNFDANGVTRLWNGFENEEEANAFIQVIDSLKPLGNHYNATFLTNGENKGLILQISVLKTPDILFASDDKAYIRRSAQNIPVDTAGLHRLKLDKGITSFESETIECHLNEVCNSMKIIEFMLSVVPSSEPEPWLRKQRLIINDKPTVSGILLFSEEPQAILPKRSAIKLYRYQTKEEAGERDFLVFDPITVEGCLYDLVYSAVDQCVEIIEGIEKLGSSGLEEVSYPSEAIHEIITNAVVHRDYSVPSDIHVRIFDNRVEIESPGKLPGHITIKNILHEQFARNAQIVRIINKFPNPPNKDVGEGLNTTFESMEKLRLKPPIIQELENSVLVTLRHESLGSPEQIVMEYLEKNEVITNLTARELTGIKSENTMKNVFYRLRDAEQIELVPGKLKWRKRADKPTKQI